MLSAVFSSLVFDCLVRFLGRGHLTYGAMDAMPVPGRDRLSDLPNVAAKILYRNDEFADLWRMAHEGESAATLDGWDWAQKRAELDALSARAYGLSLTQYAAVLSTFPLLDKTQPMISPEPKSFVTRDLALLAYCALLGEEPLDVPRLLKTIGVELPSPPKEYRRLDARVERYKELGAIPYRPTPKGGRVPDDPVLVESVLGALSTEAKSAEEVAEQIDEDEETVAKVLKKLVKEEDDVFASGRGKARRYYVMED